MDMVLPELYRKYESKGYFDLSQYSERDDFSSHYVWFYDMEWISQHAISNFDYEEGQNRRVLPFARTGGGDYWGWHQGKLEEMPVVFCPCDDDKGAYYAPTFIAAIFRHIFDFVSQNNFRIGNGEPWEMDLTLARKHLERWGDLFSNDMPKAWRKEITNLQTRKLSLITQGKSSYYVLMHPEEADELVKNHLKYDKYDKQFPWFD